MNCHEIGQYLAAYSEDQLPLVERGSLEQHLHGCATCASDLARMRKVWETLKVLAPVEAPAALKARVMGRLRSRQKLFRFVIPMAAAAALLLAVTLPMILSGPALKPGPLSAEDVAIIQNMDVLTAMDEAEMMDLVEDDATLAQLEKILDIEEAR